MQYRIRFVVIASIFFVGAPALAKGRPAKGAKSLAPETREAKEREARKACLEGDYAKGVSMLSELFLDTKSSVYIFNQGRCYEQSERYQEAASRFREYMRMPGAEDTELAQKHISECEELEAKKNPPVVAPVVAQPVAQPAPGVSTTNTLPVQVAARQQQSSSASGSGLRVAGVVLVGVGVAGLATGIVLNVKANSLARSIAPPNIYDRSKESTRQSYETFSWVGYGVGAAAIVTGAILCGVGWSKGSGDDSVALVPAIGPGRAGAALRGAF